MAVSEGVVLTVMPAVATAMTVVFKVTVMTVMSMSVCPVRFDGGGSKGAQSDNRERK